MTESCNVEYPDGEIRPAPFGARLLDLLSAHDGRRPIAAVHNGEIVPLRVRITDSARIAPIYITDRAGYAVYARSMCFLLALACRTAFPDATMKVDHSINSEIVVFLDGLDMTEDDVALLDTTMRELVASDAAIERVRVRREHAIDLFQVAGMDDKLSILAATNKQYVTLFRCGNYHDYLYGPLVPSLGYLNVFSLTGFDGTCLVSLPDKKNPDEVSLIDPIPMLRSMFADTERWAHFLGSSTVGELNGRLIQDDGRDTVLIAEGLHERQISQIADSIAEHRHERPLVLIAGPSSSGKTTFARRLAIQLRVLGLEPFSISADDYFVDRELTPRDSTGEYDFESLEAVDIALLNRHLTTLLDGGAVDMVRYNFITGKREDAGVPYAMTESSVLIVEGIHGLNEKMLPSIPVKSTFRVYVSALSPLNMDNHTSVYVSDVRTLRRIIRDHRSRGTDADGTLRRWPLVRVGEEKWVFPHQERADVMFNSSLLYEINVLKPHAVPLLNTVDRDSPVFPEANRMLELLSFFRGCSDRYVPANSIMREFIGGSCFE